MFAGIWRREGRQTIVEKSKTWIFRALGATYSVPSEMRPTLLKHFSKLLTMASLAYVYEAYIDKSRSLLILCAYSLAVAYFETKFRMTFAVILAYSRAT